MEQANPSDTGAGQFNLDDLLVGELEQMLTRMLIVKYPGIEQKDVDRLFQAIDIGNLDLIEQIEADLAQKSARWMAAMMAFDQ
ncbi:MAG: hypothetical protein JXA89_01515 [Anaerolineae bacterium]|nr:hypothetical protein [Anaerolineae bacterium]